MKDFLKGFGIILLAGGLLVGVLFLSPFFLSLLRKSGIAAELKLRDTTAPIAPKKTTAEIVADAHARSRNIKALYMTADVANDQGGGATRLRNHIIALADTTEINAIVIDVKEVCGAEYDEKNLKKLLEELHQKNIWTIARIVAFKDASQIYAHPEWYLTRKNPKAVKEGACARKQHLVTKNTAPDANRALLWRDNNGGYWMDPASPGVRDYLLSFAKEMSSLRFDELQFDYVRFPSDGDVAQAIYPSW
ncbi:MAG: putative glycoside hydrolase, partial [Candidatus Sungiibacteriota bacterium]